MEDERKISWSRDDKIRRVGSRKIRIDVSGGCGRVGVSGTGRAFCGGAFLRGVRRGSLFWPFGLLVIGVSVAEGMFKMNGVPN